jgi:hypothetical protein
MTGSAWIVARDVQRREVLFVRSVNDDVAEHSPVSLKVFQERRSLIGPRASVWGAHTLEEAAPALGVSEQRVCQLEDHALRKLRSSQSSIARRSWARRHSRNRLESHFFEEIVEVLFPDLS